MKKKNPVKNRKKPILGIGTFIVSYAVSHFALDIDPVVSAGIAAALDAIVVERVYPIFGLKVETPVEVEPK